MSNFIIHSIQDTHKLAAKIAKKLLRSGGVVALQGELGTGKTTFTQGFAKALGITQKVISPTFILVKQFQIPNTTKTLYHLDLYRLENISDFQQIGLEEMFISKKDIILIEWAGKAKDLLPENTIYINIEKVSENSRKVTISPPLV